MEDRGAKADEGDRQQDKAEGRGIGQEDQADAGRGHARRQRVGHGAFVGVKAHERLQDRGRALEDKGDEADLREGKLQVFLQQGIACGDQGLHQVIQEMAKRHGKDHRDDGGFGGVV